MQRGGAGKAPLMTTIAAVSADVCAATITEKTAVADTTARPSGPAPPASAAAPAPSPEVRAEALFYYSHSSADYRA